MPPIDETTLGSWTGPASDAEEARYNNAKRAVTDAINASGALFADAALSVYPKGSYPAYTNVVRDSDVDIAVEMTSIVYNKMEHEAAGLENSDFGLTPYASIYDPAALKNDVERALVAAFGRAAVTRGNKALQMRRTSSRMTVDVVACYSRRIYTNRAGGCIDGTTIWPDTGTRWIDNFPAQHLERGTQKNDRTSRRYKRCVRILKRLENKMVADGASLVVPSFLIESLVWNIDDSIFSRSTWTDRVKGILGNVWEGLEPDAAERTWLEANGVQYLFGVHQGWNRAQARQFAYDAWNYLGYG
jgi:hypothetical protein